MEKLINSLNTQVANLGVLFTKLHNYHWFVEGKQFFRLHDYFEELYDEMAELFDEVAERILMIDGSPIASLKEFLEHTTLEEETKKLDSKDMVKSVLKDFKQVDKELKETTIQAQELGDEVTADLLIGMSASFQKHIWFLNATLK